MLLHSCLRVLENLNAKVRRRRRAPRAAVKPPSVRPCVELLESRIVPNSSTAIVTVTAGTLTIKDSIAAKVSINENFNAHTGTNYQVAVTDATGTTSTTVTGVKNIAVNLSGNAPAADSVALTHTSGSALTGKLTIADTDAALDNLSVSIGSGFNVNGAVTITAAGKGSAVGVTSTSDSLGSVTVTSGAANASAGSSLVALSNDMIAGDVKAILTAGAGNSDAVNLVNDTIGGAAIFTETGVASSTGETAKVSNTSLGAGLTVSQSSSKSQSLIVNIGSSVGNDLAVSQTGTLNAAVSLADSSVGGAMNELQAGASTSATSLVDSTVGSLTATQKGGTASFGLNGATVATSATIVQGFGNNATTTMTNGSSVGALTITQSDSVSNTANVGSSHDGGALNISQTGGSLSTANKIALSGNLVVMGALTLTQTSDGTNAIAIDDSALIGPTIINQNPGLFASQSNSVEFGSAAGDSGMTLFGNAVTVNQGVAGTNTDTIATAEYVDFANTATFALDQTGGEPDSITDTLAKTLGFNNLTANVPITVV